MDLHMILFDGTTFGMPAQSPQAFRRMKQNIFAHRFLRWGSWRTKHCVQASDLAAVMGEASWLVRECKCMERVRWGDSDWYWVFYGEPIKPAVGPVFIFN